MPISNTTQTIVSSRPYHDDFDPAKQFYRILFRPRRSLQTREVNQLQTIIQDQIERFGSHIFQDGSVVLGGGLTLDVSVQSIKIERTFGGNGVDLETFFNTTTNEGTIITGNSSGAKARVVQYDPREGETQAMLIVSYLSAAQFTAAETITNGTTSATIAGTVDEPFANASVASVDSGVYFVDGMFISVSPQTLVLEAQSNLPSARIGFMVQESIITESDDASLLDNALGASNYLAPGAHRLKIALILTKKSLTGSTSVAVAADEQFIEIARVVTGELTKLANIPQYAELEKTLARRTYDESGHYTVRPFNIQVKNDIGGDSSMLSIGLDSGKAYVFGYEFETIGTQYITMRRGRDTASENNFDISMSFGNFIVANNLTGFLNIANHDVLDLHCVPKASVSVGSATTYTSTQIGTSRARSEVYVAGGTGATRTYNVYLTDIRLKSITLNAVSSNATGVTLITANSAQVANAYNGAVLTVISGPGIGQTFSVNAYTGNSTVCFAGLTPNTYLGTFTANTQTQVRLDFGTAQIESFSKPTSSVSITPTANGDVALEGRVGGAATGDAILYDQDNALLFPFPHAWIKAGSLGDLNYQTIRVFSGVTFSGNSTVTTLTLTTNNGNERFYPSPKTLSDPEVLASYLVVKSSDGSIIPFNANGISSSVIASVATGVPGQITFTANGSNVPNSNQVSVLARLSINSSSPRTKTLVSANTTATAGTNLAIGQLVIAAPNNTPGAIMSVCVPDVIQIQKIYTSPNVATAPTTAHMIPGNDVTSQYILDTGQRDNMYDHATIQLKSSGSPAAGQLLVCFDSYSHTGNGFFTVDSYLNVDYASIPVYTSPTTGQAYALRDVLDFRPTRQANTTEGLTTVWYVVTGQQLPHPVSTFEADYQHYLGRTDALVLTRDREFEIVEGIASQVPVAPPVADDGMTLYNITVPPYTPNTTVVTVAYVENKRYTMRDIGRLERRMENLEYYTALNFLEKSAKDQTILDVNQIERFKNGLLVEPFSGHQIADVQDADYQASIDIHARNLMQSFVSNATSFTYNNSSSSSGVVRTGDLITLSYTTTPFIVQPLNSNTVAINPFQVVNYLGTMALTPSSDVWYDGTTIPAVYMNVVGENDNWVHIGFGTEWNDWASRWIGLSLKDSRADVTSTPYTSRLVGTTSAPSTLISKLLPETITRTVGNRVVDVSVVPYMRTQNVWILSTGLKPLIGMDAYFDGTEVTAYVERANILNLAANAAYLDGAGVHESITSATGSGTGRVIAVRGNKVKIVEANGQFVYANGAAAVATGAISSVAGSVVSYEHWSGTVASANSTAIILNSGAAANNSYYNGLTISITRGPGAGGQAAITSYDGSTKVATINATSSTVNTAALTTSSRYSIGTLTSDGLANSTVFLVAGDFHGVFYLPATAATRFRTGSRLFRLTDNTDQTQASTAAEAQFHAMGTTSTFDGTAVSTRQMIIRRAAVANDSVVVTNRTIQDSHSDWIDPLVQTIIIDPLTYPSGACLRKVDLFFQSKDTHGAPITLQIRPTLNGYPLNGVIVPFGEVTLSPDSVNVSNTPSVDVANTATCFTFQAPVFLLPGVYAITVLTNSKDYVLHTAKLGAQQANSTVLISQQPYAGQLFRSQNAGVWTAADDEDLMFRVHRAVFSTGTGTAQFTANNPTANVDFDTMYLATGHLDFAGTVTSLTYQAANTTGVYASAAALTPNQNVPLTTRGRLLAAGNTYIVRATVSSADDAVSPIFDAERLALVTIEHKISNGGLVANGYIVTSPGSGYANSANVTLTITGNGSGADAVATTNSTGYVTGVTVNVEGSGYTQTPTVAVGGGGTGATVAYVGETSVHGGNGRTRYITRRVTLADGFDAADLVVYLGAYRPVGTNIDVYYKVLASSDPQQFDDKNWTQFVAASNQALLYSANENDFKDLTYNTSANNAAYTSAGVTYSRFKTFAIKIVFRSTTTTLTPHGRDLRVIAVDN